MSTALTLGTWLREKRNELGITQDELSERLGFSPAMLRKLEAGERRPSGQIASLLGAYFRIPEDEREAFIAFARAGRVVSISESGSDDVARLAPWRSTYPAHTNLPAMLATLIGREREEEAARSHLLDSKTRLLTLTGTPGIGKTHLGLHVASSLAGHFEGGVYFVDLASITEPDLVMSAIARTLGLDVGSQPVESVLLGYLRSRRVLLLLDNFEQVLDAGPAVAKLLEASRWLKVVVTSREALHIRGERRFPVPPLGLPDPAHLPPLDVLLTYPSVELFVERAQAVHPEFSLTEQNAADVAAVCIGLEGLPLAIELAAARSRHSSSTEMRSALGSRLKMLTGGARDLPARHRTLRAAIDWSYNLLDPTEQHLFRHLGVFVGGFASPAVEAIFENLVGSSAAVPQILESLIDKHIVSKEKQAVKAAGAVPPVRYRLLEAIREYAMEQMEEHAQVDKIKRRHAEYYLSLAEQAEQHFTGPQDPGWGAEQIVWIDTLELELDNIRAALDWYQSQAEANTVNARVIALDNTQKGLRLAIALRRVWIGRDHAMEGLQRILALLSQVPKPLPTESRQLEASYARALLMVGRLSTARGVTVATPVRPLIEESLSIFTRLNDRQQVALTLFVAGAVAHAEGDHTAARLYGTDCLKLYRELGNRWGAAAVMQDLGNIALMQGDFRQARSFFEESLTLSREVGDYFTSAFALERLGHMAYSQQDYAAARSLWRESLEHHQIGSRSSASHIIVLLGWASLRESNYIEAASLFSQGLLLARELGAAPTIHWALAGFGALAGAQQDLARSALFFGSAEALQEAGSIELSVAARAELDSSIAEVCSEPNVENWKKAWMEGYSMRPDEAITSALSYDVRKAQGGKAMAPSRTWK